MWKHELEDESFVIDGNESYLQVIDEFVFDLTSMHGQNIPAGYLIEVKYTFNDKAGTIELEDGSEITTGEGNEIVAVCSGGILKINLDKGKGPLNLSEITIMPSIL